ncbi:MAG TPA: cation transporter [Candidatus Angelobacter sp.]|nr:cation transporter [Candidatus Angelobacter sp.]
MSAACCQHGPPPARDDGFRRVLWIALIVNAGMFLVEGVSGLLGDSVSLQADALDFLGDAANYGLGLAVLGLALTHRATAALIKGVSMGLFGLWVVGAAVHNMVAQTVPSPAVMGAVGFLALAANLGVAVLLYRHRQGDSNRRSVWLCTRNDAIGNLAVMLAASGVFASGTAWPDLAVAVVMAALALSSSYRVIMQAVGEIRGAASLTPAE